MESSNRLSCHDWQDQCSFGNVGGAKAALDSENIYSRLQFKTALAAHTGCVNSLDWTSDGARLLSGSDDGKMVVWSYPANEMVCRQETQHQRNIFSCRWMDNRNVCSGAGDGIVRYWSAREGHGFVKTAEWRCHEDRVKRLDVNPMTPYSIVSAGEDGSVRYFDCRERSGSCTGEYDCRHIVFVNPHIPLNSCSQSRLDATKIAYAGKGAVVRFADLRMFRNDFIEERRQKYWIACEMVGSISAVRFAKQSMEVVSSVMGNKIQLIDYHQIFSNAKTDPPHIHATPLFLRREQARAREANRLWRAGNYQGYWKLMSDAIKYHRFKQFEHIPCLRTFYKKEVYNRIICMFHLGIQDQFDLAHEVEAFARGNGGGRDLPSKQSDLIELVCLYLGEECWLEERRVDGGLLTKPQIVGIILILEPFDLDFDEFDAIAAALPTRSYRSHKNSQTTKDIEFAGMNEDLIASGSDGGFFFLWGKETGRIVMIGKSDEHVVNCVVENPKIPAFAVSGIDSDIKIWEPSFATLSDANPNAAMGKEEKRKKWYSVSKAERPKFLQSFANTRTDDFFDAPPCIVQ